MKQHASYVTAGTRQDRFHIDLRSLSVFRILLGISILYDAIFIRFSYITEFSGGATLIPRTVLQKMNGWNSFSVFDLVHNDAFAYAFFMIFLLSAVLYTAGIFTRISSIVTCFLFWNILQVSSSFVFGFEMFAFILLFWSCFLPLGTHFSVLRPKKHYPVRPVFAFLLLLQISCIYFVSGWSKHGISWSEGFAVRNILMDKWAVTTVGASLAGSAWFYKTATYITLVFECIFPLLVFVRSGNYALRYAAAAFLFCFHMFIFLSYDVGSFSITGLAVAALLLPESFWEKLAVPGRQISAQAPVGRWRHRAVYAFAVFAGFVMLQKNAFFLLKNSAIGRKEAVVNLTRSLSFIDIPSPVRISFFHQAWKMFAPNPPVKAGWIALEKKMPDGTYQDFFTGRQIMEEPSMNWKPSGMEYYLLTYARTFDYPETASNKFRIFLKYWIPYKLKQYEYPPEFIDQVVFTDYLYIVEDQSKPYTPKVSVNIYEAREIAAATYKIELL